MLKFLIHNWYRIGFILGIIILIALIFNWSQINQIQRLLIINLLCLFAHQFEEYQLPGGAPIIINRTVYNETKLVDRYPGNDLSIMLVNTIAWIIYCFSIYFYNLYWLGLGVVLFSLFQIAGHCIEMPIKLKAWYNPGMATTYCLFLPTGIIFINKLNNLHLLNTQTWLLGILTLIACIALSIILPVQSLKNKNTKYPIDPWQIKRFKQIMKMCKIGGKYHEK